MTEPSSNVFPQSAVIPYRKVDGRLQVALITSRSGARWVLPKGLIDPGEEAADSAAREAVEEAGLIGRVSDDAIGRYQYDKWGGTCDVEVFLLAVDRVMTDWEESFFRDREWMAPEEAARRVREPDLKRLLQSLPDIVEGSEVTDV